MAKSMTKFHGTTVGALTLDKIYAKVLTYL